MPVLGNITFYAEDPRRLAHFWSDVFGYPRLEWDDPLKADLLAKTRENCVPTPPGFSW